MTSEARAGLAREQSRLSLPAATTINKPALTAALTALSRADEMRPPRDMLPTEGLGLRREAALAAHWTPSMTPALVPDPVSPRTLTATMEALLAHPHLFP